MYSRYILLLEAINHLIYIPCDCRCISSHIQPETSNRSRGDVYLSMMGLVLLRRCHGLRQTLDAIIRGGSQQIHPFTLITVMNIIR
jgi:hypothetical protein